MGRPPAQTTNLRHAPASPGNEIGWLIASHPATLELFIDQAVSV